MKGSVRLVVVGLLGLSVLGWSLGCKTSSYKSVRTYEYSNAPPPSQTQEREESTEWQMQSPGEMIVDP